MSEEIITSATNKEVKLLRSLHERKYRKQTGLFLAEGMRICLEAISLGQAPRKLVYAASRAHDKPVRELIDACRGAGGRSLAVSEDLLSRISRKDNPQMVIGAFEARFASADVIVPKDNKLWVALDRVRDPGNLGTIMRTADAVGATGVILIDDCTDPILKPCGLLWVPSLTANLLNYHRMSSALLPKAGLVKLLVQPCKHLLIIARLITAKPPLC